MWRVYNRLVRSASVALLAAAALSAPAYAQFPSDAHPTPQAIAAHAEFLAQAPPPPRPGTVCVIDTGVTPVPDMGNQVIARLAIDGGDPGDVYHDPADPTSGHGSFVASAIASQVDGQGSAGIWPHARIVSVRVFGQGGAAASDYIAAIAVCRDPKYDVKVINISVGGLTASPAELERLEDRIDQTIAAGLNIVASAGNSGSSVAYPARIRGVLAVGATDAGNLLCGFSSRGEQLDLSALGCDSHLTTFGASPGRFAGTSYAAPFVSAVLVALRSYQPQTRADQAERLLLATSDTSQAGRTLNASALFTGAGLTSLVELYRPPRRGIDSTEKSLPSNQDQSPRPSLNSVVIHSFPRVRALPRPRIGSVTYSNTRLRIAVAKVPKRVIVVLRVDGKAFRRSAGLIRVMVPPWRRLSVRFEDEWGLKSDATLVDRKRRRVSWRQLT